MTSLFHDVTIELYAHFGSNPSYLAVGVAVQHTRKLL